MELKFKGFTYNIPVTLDAGVGEESRGYTLDDVACSLRVRLLVDQNKGIIFILACPHR